MSENALNNHLASLNRTLREHDTEILFTKGKKRNSGYNVRAYYTKGKKRKSTLVSEGFSATQSAHYATVWRDGFNFALNKKK